MARMGRQRTGTHERSSKKQKDGTLPQWQAQLFSKQ